MLPIIGLCFGVLDSDRALFKSFRVAVYWFCIISDWEFVFDGGTDIFSKLCPRAMVRARGFVLFSYVHWSLMFTMFSCCLTFECFIWMISFLVPLGSCFFKSIFFSLQYLLIYNARSSLTLHALLQISELDRGSKVKFCNFWFSLARRAASIHGAIKVCLV